MLRNEASCRVVLLCLLTATDAAAQSPAPTLVRFDATDVPGLYTDALLERAPGCVVDKAFLITPAAQRAEFLFAPCGPTLRLTFPTPRASVQLFARVFVGLGPGAASRPATP